MTGEGAADALPGPGPWTAAPSAEAIDAFRSGMSRFRRTVLRSDALAAGEIVGVRLLETPVAPARLNGEPTAALGICRRCQAQLSLGEVARVDGREAIRRPRHG